MSDKPIVVIVDDDEMVSEATAELIEILGLSARTFASAKAFLNSDCVLKASCLIADVQLPGIDGLQLHRKLTRAGQRIPVIFITAFPDDSLRKRALKAGAICYLKKPFDPKDLEDCVRLAIGH